jgi:hypothetical protein
MNRGQLVFECSRSLGLDDTATSDELILLQRWVNRGIVDVLEKTHCFTDVGQMTLTPNVTDYRIDANILVVDNITLPDSSGAPYELEQVSMSDLLPFLNPAIASTTTPTKAAMEGTFLRVAPSPSSAIVLTYIYTPHPTEITADGTTASDSIDPSTAAFGGVPIEYHDAILMYMMWQGAQYDQQGGGFFRGHAFAPGSAFQATYEARIKEIRRMLRRKKGRGLAPATIGYPDRRGVAVRNDVYPLPGR